MSGSQEADVTTAGSRSGSTPILAANADMLFTELSFVDRVRAINDLGFLVEIWDWSSRSLEELRRTGSTFSSMTGYLSGDLITEEGSKALVESAVQSLRAADVLDCPRLNLHGTGLDSTGLPVRPHPEPTTQFEFESAVSTLKTLAALGESAGRIFTIENLNRRTDHPGTPFATSADTSALVRAVDSPSLRLNLDLYHLQIDEGDLITRTTELLPLVGEIQVADVPGRQQPGTGEIHYPAIARALAEAGYSGVVALEAWASDSPEHALAQFRAAFTP